jgi:hypothetical protein
VTSFDFRAFNVPFPYSGRPTTSRLFQHLNAAGASHVKANMIKILIQQRPASTYTVAKKAVPVSMSSTFVVNEGLQSSLPVSSLCQTCQGMFSRAQELRGLENIDEKGKTYDTDHSHDYLPRSSRKGCQFCTLLLNALQHIGKGALLQMDRDRSYRYYINSGGDYACYRICVFYTIRKSMSYIWIDMVDIKSKIPLVKR